MAPHDIRFTTAAGHFAAYQDHFRGLYEQGRAPAPLTQLYETACRARAGGGHRPMTDGPRAREGKISTKAAGEPG